MTTPHASASRPILARLVALAAGLAGLLPALFADTTHTSSNADVHDIGQWFTQESRINYGTLGKRTWVVDANGELKSFKFEFDHSAGITIAHLGRSPRGSTWEPARIDQIPNPSYASATLSFQNTAAGKWVFAVYGWTDVDAVYTPSNPMGYPWMDEWYIIDTYNYNPGSGDGDALPDISVGGHTYKCYRYLFVKKSADEPDRYRFKAYRVGGNVGTNASFTRSPTINVQPFLAHFRAHGMDNDYLVYLSWTAEMLVSPNKGSYTLTNVEIPNPGDLPRPGVWYELQNVRSATAGHGRLYAEGSNAYWKDAYIGNTTNWDGVRWMLTDVGNGWYTLNNKLTLGNGYLYANNGNADTEALVGNANVYNGSRWRLRYTQQGAYEIINDLTSDSGLGRLYFSPLSPNSNTLGRARIGNTTATTGSSWLFY